MNDRAAEVYAERFFGEPSLATKTPSSPRGDSIAAKALPRRPAKILR